MRALLSCLAMALTGLMACTPTQKAVVGALVTPEEAPADPALLLAEARSRTEGPVLLVVFEETGQAAAITPIETNAGVITWASPNRRTISTRDGIIVATRGLGNDLMALTQGARSDLLAARKAGSAAVEVRVLTPEGLQRRIPLACELRPVSPAQVDETCRAGEEVLSMHYTFGPEGTLVESRQWLGPELGMVRVSLH